MAWAKTLSKLAGWLGLAAWLAMAAGALALDWPSK